MSAKPRYLTKSRFKVAYECPAKLFYNERPKEYANKKHENEFLQALARGGFQVGALAKLYYPGGEDLEEIKDSQTAIERTRELLKQENVTIYEAAIQCELFLARVDILVKKGSQIDLIEVKSKSVDSQAHKDFFKSRDNGLDRDWEPYLVDIAYQTWVARKAHPAFKYRSFLLLPDKASVSTIDGIHQHFRLLSKDGKHSRVQVTPGLTGGDLGAQLLAEVLVDGEVKYVINEHIFPHKDFHMDAYAYYLAEHHAHQTRGESRISSLCKACEFRAQAVPPQRSGFIECWESDGKLNPGDLDRGIIFDIWDYRDSQKLLSQGKAFFDQLSEDDLKPKTKPKSKSEKVKRLQRYQRQWLQVEKFLSKDPTPYVDREGLTELFNSLSYPLHCIDFETTTVAIPFHRGRRPYEQIAFQFSHHVLHEDGRVEHADQFLDMRAGAFPNFEFVRKLRESLSKDQGSIFRYASHENTVLRQIRAQLVATPEPDHAELLAFIDSITKPTDKEKDSGVEGVGSRCMFDLRDVVLEHYYHPLMGGSNSIKKVIPAVLEGSEYLKKKYANPIKSLNFDSRVWIELDRDGKVLDPYKSLPPVFADIAQSAFEGDGLFTDARLFEKDSIDDGGAAMTAWSRMQFTEMTEVERNAIEAALLKYCELDTLSMVWLLEMFLQLHNIARRDAGK
jgi:hypothetical protein